MRQLYWALTITLAIALGAALTQLSEALPPCETEDSINCYWDADVQGNGQGQDLVNTTP
jgi:hypothetical protein